MAVQLSVGLYLVTTGSHFSPMLFLNTRGTAVVAVEVLGDTNSVEKMLASLAPIHSCRCNFFSLSL